MIIRAKLTPCVCDGGKISEKKWWEEGAKYEINKYYTDICACVPIERKVKKRKKDAIKHTHTHIHTKTAYTTKSPNTSLIIFVLAVLVKATIISLPPPPANPHGCTDYCVTRRARR